MLDFWRSFRSVRAQEEGELVEAIEPRFNRLTVFDPRLPHGVRRVEGSMDPREGRLVIHGWFVQPRPFVEGPLPTSALSSAIGEVTDAIAPRLNAGLSIAGLLSVGFAIGANGRPGPVSLLSDTTRVAAAEEEPERRSLIRTVTRTLARHSFPRRAKPSRVTLPLVFER